MCCMSGKMAIHVDRVAHRILLVRRQRVLLDEDLAALYGVSTKRFNEQVRRNARRFPTDFMLRLTQAEWASLRSQNATLKTGRGQHRKYPPLAFTEHGAIMAATVLNTRRATQVAVYVVRAFVRLREFLATHKGLARRLDSHARKLAAHDQAITGLIATLQKLMSPEAARRRPIGFVTPE